MEEDSPSSPSDISQSTKRKHSTLENNVSSSESIDSNKEKRISSLNETDVLTVDTPITSIPTTFKLETIINPMYCTETWINKAREKFRQQRPFPHLFLPNCFDDDLLSKAKEELKEIPYKEQNNDLYYFFQSNDLKGMTGSNMRTLKNLIYSEDFRRWISSITGIENLSDVVDMSVARYVDTSTLLCHDDELEGRRIAYIIYLVPPTWKEENGGSLALFNVDDAGDPRDIETVLEPAWNSIAFFEVSPTSYHQVCEVFGDEERMTIGGWLHGPPIDRPPVKPLSSPTMYLIDEDCTDELKKWINPLYLDTDNVKKMQDTFVEESVIELDSFIKEDIYRAMIDDLHDQKWEVYGPAHRRHYLTVSEENTTALVKECWKFLSSKIFVKFLSSISNLESIKSYYGKIRRLTPGSYTLSQDIWNIEESALDVILCCSTGNIPEEHGGFMVYMDEEQPLVTIPCMANQLVLVYRDSGSMRFTKYINHKCKDIRFDFEMSYIPEDTEE